MKRCQALDISFISIHALLAESDCDVIAEMTDAQSISIHALLAESDNERPETRRLCAISIHALLAESDQPLIASAA